MKARNLLIIFVTASLLLLVACSSEDTNEEANGEEENGEQAAGSSITTTDPYSPFEEEISFTQARTDLPNEPFPSGDSLEDNEYTRYVHERLNVSVDYAWTAPSGETYDQRVNLAIASGDIPDVMMVNHNQLRQLVESDLVEDVTDVYETYASDLIREYHDTFDGRALEEATFDGQLMAFPNTQIGQQNNLLWVRQDWLDHLELDPPRTLDEVVDVARAFVENDPNNTGEDDTIGLTGLPELVADNSRHGFDTLFGVFKAAPKKWIENEDGSITYGSIAPEMKPALEVLRDLYAEGLIDREFALRDEPDELVVSGSAGMMFGPWWSGSTLQDSIPNDPDAEWIALPAPLDSEGKLNIYAVGPSDRFLVVREGFEHPEAVMKVLNLQTRGNRQLDPDFEDPYVGLGISWSAWPFSIQLDHYDAVTRAHLILKEAVDNESTEDLNEEQKVWYEQVMQNRENPKEDLPAWATTMGRLHAAGELLSESINEIHPVFFGTTDTMESRWASLEAMEDEALLKIILGEEPLDYFDTFVEQWKQAGGEQIIQEVEEFVEQ